MDDSLNILIINPGVKHQKSSRSQDEENEDLNDDDIISPLPHIFDLIELYDTPITPSWKFPSMFKIGLNGNTYIWQLGYIDGYLNIANGSINAIKIDKRKVELNQSGKSEVEQALQDGRTLHKNKTKDGYIVCGSIDNPNSRMMKGVIFSKHMPNDDDYPMLESTKLDGIRCIISKNSDGTIKCLTYLNSEYTHLKYIPEEAILLFDFLPPNTVFDGELFAYGMKLYEIGGAVRTYTTEHPDLKRIGYYIFDIITREPQPAEIRYQILYEAHAKFKQHYPESCYIWVVHSVIVYSNAMALEYKTYCIRNGYEGAVLRRMANGNPPGSKKYELSLYKPGRSTHMLKLKEFRDEEGIVTGVVSGKGRDSGMANLIITDVYGISTVIRFGTMADRRRWMVNPEIVVGKKFTFKYTERSPKNKPIQPTGVGFRDYE